jgi:hypothetical protein
MHVRSRDVVEAGALVIALVVLTALLVLSSTGH